MIDEQMMMLENSIFQISKLIPIENRLIVIRTALLCTRYHSILIVFLIVNGCFYGLKFDQNSSVDFRFYCEPFDLIFTMLIRSNQQWIQRT